MFQKHPTDEQLLAYFDGELNVVQLRKVRKHLNACWFCRSREARLEGQIRNLAEAHSRSTYPSAAEIDQSRREFFQRYSQLQLEERTPRPFGAARKLGLITSGLPRISLWRVVAASIAGCAVLLGLWSLLSPPALTAHQVLQAAQYAEREVYARQPVHQSFQVDVAQLKPSKIRHRGRLEVWVDAAGKRYSTRWNDQSGELRRAVWRPNVDHEYVYDSELSPTVQSVDALARPVSENSLTGLASNGLSVPAIEEGFSSWLQERQWEPISFIPELLAIANQPGLNLTMEEIGSGQGAQFRVRARRQIYNVAVEITLDVDCDSHFATVQQLTFESDTHTVELRLTDRRIEPVERAAIRNAVFEPDFALMRHEDASLSTPLPQIAHETLVIPSAEDLPGPTQAELDASEMAVRFALHKVGACLGEPVEVVREPKRILVRGVVESAARKQELLTVLSELQDLQPGSIDIHALDEVGSDDSMEFTEGVSDASPVSDSQLAREENRTTFVATEVPIQNRLTQYFRNHWDEAGTGPIDNLSRQTMQFSARTVDESKRTLTEAWALRRLAQRYGTNSHLLSLPSRGLLDLMLRDHMRSLNERTLTMRGHLDPVLAEIVPVSAEATVKSIHSLSVGNGENVATWAEICAETFNYIQRTDALIIALFAGAGFPLEPDSEHPDRMIAITPEQALADLHGTLLPAITNNLQRGLPQTATNPTVRIRGEILPRSEQ